MRHYTSSAFWRHFDALPEQIQQLARRSYDRLKTNPRHPSLHLKKVDRYFSVRVGSRYRALGVEVADGILWLWCLSTFSPSSSVRCFLSRPEDRSYANIA